MPDYLRMYSKQEYQTPGAARTVEVIAETVRPAESSWLLDVASGKGEAAATLAARFACNIVAVEIWDPNLHYSAAKFWHYNLRDLITLVRGNGRRLPVQSGQFDAAYCIGAPSIVGLEACVGELTRAVRGGGHVIVSDAVWRTKPVEPLGPEWAWVASMRRLSAEEYAAVLADAGLEVIRTETHPQSDWHEYWAPMLEVAREAKISQPADPLFADEVESGVELERRAVDAWLDYATFVARKPA